MSDRKPRPVPEPSRRLEIYRGAGRRRSWSAEQKARIVSESLCGGASVSAVARRHGLTPAQLSAWRRQVRGGSVGGGKGLAFAPVVVARSAVEIEFGDAVIRVPAGVDAATVLAALQAVKALT